MYTTLKSGLLNFTLKYLSTIEYKYLMKFIYQDLESISIFICYICEKPNNYAFSMITPGS